jgi:hypothetical protein
MKPPQTHHAEEEWLETELMATAAEKAAAVHLAGAGWAHLEEGSEMARSLEMPFDAACSLQRQVLTEKVIQTRKKLGTKGPAILRSFQCDGVLEASREFELPPLQVLERCLQELGMSAKEVQVALNEPNQLSAKLLREFQSARSADGVSETLEQSARTRELAAAFESAVQTRLKRTGVLFMTEDEQKSKASNAGVRFNPTPDFLIDPETNLVVGGAEVRWIEVKNFFGSTLGYHKQQLQKQLTNYRRLYGPGAVVFSLGAGESMRLVLPKGVLVLASPGGGSPPPRARESPVDSDVSTLCAAETAVPFPEPTPELELEPEPEPEPEPQPVVAARLERQLYFFRTMSNGEDGADDCELDSGCPFCGSRILWDGDGPGRRPSWTVGGVPRGGRTPPRAGMPAYCNRDDCEQNFVFEDPGYRPRYWSNVF